MPDRIHVAGLPFVLHRSSNRTTVGITVERNGELLLRVPDHLDVFRVQEWVRRKRPWVLDKLAKKDLLLSHQSTRSFVSGEGFDYLGATRRRMVRVSTLIGGLSVMTAA